MASTVEKCPSLAHKLTEDDVAMKIASESMINTLLQITNSSVRSVICELIISECET